MNIIELIKNKLWVYRMKRRMWKILISSDSADPFPGEFYMSIVKHGTDDIEYDGDIPTAQRKVTDEQVKERWLEINERYNEHK